jgi:hypothetical protein
MIGENRRQRSCPASPEELVCNRDLPQVTRFFSNDLAKQPLLVHHDENEHVRDYKSKEAQPKETEEHAI